MNSLSMNKNRILHKYGHDVTFTYKWHIWTGFIVSLLLLVACEGQPTPFPAQLPTDTPSASEITDSATPSATNAPSLRYAIDPSLANIPIRLEGNYTRIQAATPLASSDIQYDIAVMLGGTEGWQTSPIPLSIGLILRPSANFTDIIWRAIDPPVLIERMGVNWITPLHDGTTPAIVLRNELANLGKPDGFAVTMGMLGIIGEEALRDQLRTLLIEIAAIPITIEDRIPTLQSGMIDMVLVSWFTEAERDEWVNLVGEANLLPLFSVPISYQAMPDLTITLSIYGLPEVSD